MDILLEFITKEILAPLLHSSGPFVLFAAVLATLFAFGGWAVSYILLRLWRRDREYWRTMQTLRHNVHDELVKKVLQVMENFIAAAAEQRKLIGALLAGRNNRR